MIMPNKAFISGATNGLGEALARLLSSQKWALFLTGRKRAKLDLLATELPQVTIFPADLSKPHERKDLIKKLEEYIPDLIINNAGFGLYGDAIHLTLEEQLEMVEVNVNAVMEISISMAKCLRSHEKKGVIVNISSASAFFTIPAFATYTATKSFVNQFSQTLDEELKPSGIRVLTSCPGQIKTAFRERASHGHPQQPSLFAMTPKKAAQHILWQIEKGKSLYVFDWKYRLTRFIPKRWISSLLRHSIEKRISQRVL